MAHRLSELGRRERQIMDVVIRLGRASAVDVERGLPGAPASSTVSTLPRVLERKGGGKAELEGPRFLELRGGVNPSGQGPRFTSPRPAPAPQLRRSAARHLLETFFAGSVESAV